MAVDKLVDSAQLDADLTSVANAIRAKSGGSGQLSFPAGFISEIEDIPSGGGGASVVDELLGLTPTGDVVYVPDANVPMYAIIGKKRVSKLTIDFQDGYDFVNQSSGAIVSNEIPIVVINGRNGVHLPNYVIQNCKTPFIIVIKGIVYLSGQNTFRNNSGLTLCDITWTSGNGIGYNEFMADSSFETLILRSESVVPLANINAFTSNTKFASGGTGGTLYVPQSLLSEYQSATNWSTILGYTNNQIKSIESTHTDPNAPIDLTTHYADGTPISS